jgi:hypothetical protein
MHTHMYTHEQKELKKVETDDANSISALEKLIEALATKSKNMSRNIDSLREKLNTFIGHVSVCMYIYICMYMYILIYVVYVHKHASMFVYLHTSKV